MPNPQDDLSKYVGNHGGAYTDESGMSRQFTYIDHDKKTKISTNITNENVTPAIKKYRVDLIKRITNLSASLCPDVFQDFTIRGEGKKKIEWNTDMLIDPGVPLNMLRDICSLTENKAEFMK